VAAAIRLVPVVAMVRSGVGTHQYQLGTVAPEQVQWCTRRAVAGAQSPSIRAIFAGRSFFVDGF
jgi:hypothetical protein